MKKNKMRSRTNTNNKAARLNILSRISDRERADTLGSYTGTPADARDLVPEQDPDDL